MQNEKTQPLPERMRPLKLADFIGQEHLIDSESLLSRAILTDKLGSCIFYGPPGVGKTTLATIVAQTTNGAYEKLNAVSSGSADAKRVIEEARKRMQMSGKRTYLILDECHRWNKAQADSVLAAIEDGSIIFIGTTTENPYMSMTRALVSRCRIFELKPLSNNDIKKGLKRAIADKKSGYGNIKLDVSEEALDHFVWSANGDMRDAYNALELAVLSSKVDASGGIVVDKKLAEQSSQRRALSVDETLYYDMLSAFCKSLRGSSSDGALYYAFRLIESGCDPMLIFRRLIVHASEDVGMANSNALNVAVNACLAYERMGAPEGFIPLSHAIICVTTSPKSNSVVTAMKKVRACVRENGSSNVPHHLRNHNDNYPNFDGSVYKYPHDYGGYVAQSYLPEELKDMKFYQPTHEGEEADVCEFISRVKDITGE